MSSRRHRRAPACRSARSAPTRCTTRSCPIPPSGNSASPGWPCSWPRRTSWARAGSSRCRSGRRSPTAMCPGTIRPRTPSRPTQSGRRRCPSGRSQVYLEPLNRYEAKFLNRVEQGADLAARINHPRVTALADLFHMNIEEAHMGEPIVASAAQLRHVHISDNNRLEPGAGCLDIATSFAALAQIGYSGFVTLECRLSGPAEETLPASARYLRGLWDPTTAPQV